MTAKKLELTSKATMTIVQVDYEKILVSNNLSLSGGFRIYDNPNIEYFTVTFNDQSILLRKIVRSNVMENRGVWQINFDSINDIQQPINFNKVINFPDNTINDPIDYTEKLSTTNLVHSKNTEGKTVLTSTLYSSSSAQVQYKYVIRYTMDR